jgi:hypothetical protein
MLLASRRRAIPSNFFAGILNRIDGCLGQRNAVILGHQTDHDANRFDIFLGSACLLVCAKG